MKTEKINQLFGGQLKVINIGLDSFSENLQKENFQVENLDWSPPAGGDQEMNELLDQVASLDKIEKANKETINRIQESEPVLVGVGTAQDLLPNFSGKMILHAAPPVSWDEMSGPMQGAVIGAVIYEGWADEQKAAKKLIESGEISFEPGHHHDAVGPMTGVISPSMPVWIVENKTYGNRAYCTMNEGLGKVLRFGANDSEVIEKLNWIENTLGPALKEAVDLVDQGINLKNITSQALHMGDEVHNRNKAGSSLFLKTITPYLLEIDQPLEKIREIISFISENEHFYLNLSMPASKSIMDAASGIENSTILTAMARNGVEFGIRISGLGDRWFTAPANYVDGLYFPGYSQEDACPDLGDSTISETAAVGGFAMAAAPAIVGFVGGTVTDAISHTKEMYQITAAENDNFSIPFLDFRGTPTGIDFRKVIETGILPTINTGIAHKEAGVGQIGAGLVRPPLACFKDAIRAFVKKYNLK